MSTSLGENQRQVLRTMAGDSRRSASRRPYPGGGWVWDNDSTTRRLLDSLVNRGLVHREGDTRTGRYTITAQGCRIAGVSLTQAELDAEQAANEAAARADREHRAHHCGHVAAMADAQACKSGANGTDSWRSREHKIPQDAGERAAWMRGYGRQFAYWGGAQEGWPEE